MSFSGFNSGPGFGSSNPSFGFGGGNLSPGFGASPSTFGAASTGSSLFGGASGFGGGNVFGTNPASSPFGGTSTTAMFGSTSTTGFGASSPFAGTSFGNASSGPFGTSSFGTGFGTGSSTTVTGTSQVAFSPFQETDQGGQSRNGIVHFQNISAMKVYEGFCPDELRAMDYQAGNKGGSGTSGMVSSFGTGGGSMFGGAGQSGFNFGSSTGGFTSGIGTGSGFGQSSSTAPFFGGGFSASSGSMFGGQNAASGFRQNTQPFGGGTAFGQSSSPFGGFGSSSSTSTNIFAAASAPATNFGASSGSVFGSFGQSSSLFGQTGSAPAFGAQSSTPAFGGATFGSGFAASSSASFGFQQSGTSQNLFGASSGSMFGGTTNAFGTSSTGTNMFTQSNTSMFGGGASGGSIFGANSRSTPFGSTVGASQPTNIFGAQQPAPSFGGVSQTTTFQTQPGWGLQATAPSVQGNPQNFSAIYGRIAPDLPIQEASGPQFKIGLRAAIPSIALGRKRLDRDQMLATWRKEWQAERKKETWKPKSSQLTMTRWDNVKVSPGSDMFQTRASREAEDGPSRPSAIDTEDTVWPEYKPKESLFSQPKTLDKLIDPEGGIEIEGDTASAPPWTGEERLLTAREIKQRLPTIVDKEYYVKPDIRGLTNMLRGDPNALREVYGLVIGRHGYGYIKYSVPINIEGADICSRITFRKGGVVLFSPEGREDNSLDGACEVTLENVFLLDKNKNPIRDEKSCEKMRDHLIKYCKTEGIAFVSYADGVWRFKHTVEAVKHMVDFTAEISMHCSTCEGGTAVGSRKSADPFSNTLFMRDFFEKETMGNTNQGCTMNVPLFF